MRGTFLPTYLHAYYAEEDHENHYVEMVSAPFIFHFSEVQDFVVFPLDVVCVFMGNSDYYINQMVGNVHLENQKGAF